MIDLKELTGLPLQFDPETLQIKLGDDIFFKTAWEKKLDSSMTPNDPLWKSLKFAQEFTDEQGNIINQPNLEEFWKGRFYFGFRCIFIKNDEFLKLIDENNIMPDITILPAGDIDNEYVRTEGHEHLSNFPEIYQVILGKVIFLIFKPKKDRQEDIEDVIAVLADVGDNVIFPPGYYHITVNIGDSSLVVADWNSTKANSDFHYIKNHNGAPYWVIKGENGPEFQRNPRYKGKVPQIRIVKPADEIEEFSIKKGVPMFNLAKEGKIRKLNFLNDITGKYDKVYEKLFVPI